LHQFIVYFRPEINNNQVQVASFDKDIESLKPRQKSAAKRQELNLKIKNNVLMVKRGARFLQTN